ncbi:hypothetical protein [Streptomyces gibsoniae]|uniref:Uncharacterized protein n=1 Tax=Streptomyces gibsoniae TaxID=3075529 RepID=A0ABU2TVH1_9ACTN|nr:hypothetical protein [Streptomyces sp. DSM 41699]MDT0464960.1 hypothetical protein [Streptomyces sp. DSM 41699]
MARHLTPRHITLEGREAVALTVEEYEQLVASRRQIGGQSARVRVLAHQAKRTEQLPQDLESLIATSQDPCCERQHAEATCSAPRPDAAAGERDADPECLRCAVAALLRSHRNPAS